MWMNPMMPYRHLKPRLTGTMAYKGGGGSTTNVTNTGLGDDQYQGIMDNLTENFSTSNLRYDEVKPLLDNMGVDTDQLLTDLSTLSGNQSTSFTNLNDLINQNNTAAIARDNTIGLQNTATQEGIGGLSTDMGTGFTNVRSDITGLGDNINTRFNTVDQANTNLQSSVNTGFENQATGFSDLNTRMNNELDSRNEGFAAVGKQLTGLGTGQENLEDGQTALGQGQVGLAGGISDLSGDVGAVSGNLDTYYGDLAANQAALGANQDTFVSNFDSYVEKYDDDVKLADQKRADMQQQIVGQMGDNATAVNRNVENLAQAQEQGFAAQQAATNSGFTSQMRDIAQVAQGISTLDQNVVRNFGLMSESFSDTGELLQSSINPDGTITTRTVGADGNLYAQTKNNQGQVLGTETLNLSDTLAKMQEFQASGAMSQ